MGDDDVVAGLAQRSTYSVWHAPNVTPSAPSAASTCSRAASGAGAAQVRRSSMK
jgi:hypothetical protein